MDPSEYYTYEDRAYIEPTLSRDEQLGFVSTLRDTIDKNTARINTQTQKLGTNITPNYGGLTGSNSYFKQRYQTTPVEAQMNTLKATAQAKALNDLLTNYQNQAANKYQQAYRSAAAKAAAAAAAAANGGYGGEDPEAYDVERGLTVPIDEDYAGLYTRNIDNYITRKDENGNIISTNDPAFSKNSDGYYDTTGIKKTLAAGAGEDVFQSTANALVQAPWLWAMPGGAGLALGFSYLNGKSAEAEKLNQLLK